MSLALDQSACLSPEKTEEMCTGCVRNISLENVGIYTLFSEFKITKKYIDNKFTKTCEGYWSK